MSLHIHIDESRQQEIEKELAAADARCRQAHPKTLAHLLAIELGTDGAVVYILPGRGSFAVARPLKRTSVAWFASLPPARRAARPTTAKISGRGLRVMFENERHFNRYEGREESTPKEAWIEGELIDFDHPLAERSSGYVTGRVKVASGATYEVRFYDLFLCPTYANTSKAAYLNVLEARAAAAKAERDEHKAKLSRLKLTGEACSEKALKKLVAAQKRQISHLRVSTTRKKR
jgi:hypothetical protein